MNASEQPSWLGFQVIWPLDGLKKIAQEPEKLTAIVLCIEDVEDAKAHLLMSGLAVDLAHAGVRLFALVGEESEQLHDALDWKLEEVGAEHVMTSWHDANDPEDVAAFVAASVRAVGLTRIIVVADQSMKSGARLKDCIVRAVRTEKGD